MRNQKVCNQRTPCSKYFTQVDKPAQECENQWHSKNAVELEC